MIEFASIQEHFEGVNFLDGEEKEIYNRTIIDNQGKLCTFGAKIDPALKSKKDCRYTLSLFGYFPDNFKVGGSEKFEKSLQKILPRQIYYTADTVRAQKNALLHWTVMQLIGFTDNLSVPKEDLDHYVKICERNLYKLKGPIRVQFFGLVATPVNILWMARSDNPINKIRGCLRKNVVDEGLSLKEPYVVNIIHTSILRYLNKLNVPNVLNFCEGYRTSLVSECTFDKLYLDYGSALMRPSEIRKVAEFDLVARKTTYVE